MDERCSPLFRTWRISSISSSVAREKDRVPATRKFLQPELPVPAYTKQVVRHLKCVVNTSRYGSDMITRMDRYQPGMRGRDTKLGVTGLTTT